MTDCPRHDHGRNWLAVNTTKELPCGCVVHTTTVAQVTGRPVLEPTPEPPPPPADPRRCDEPRTPHGVVRCYHPTGHPGLHSWEKTQ